VRSNGSTSSARDRVGGLRLRLSAGPPRDRRARRDRARGDAVRHGAVEEGPRPVAPARRAVPVRARRARADGPDREGRLPRRRRRHPPGEHGGAAPQGPHGRARRRTGGRL